MIVGLVHLLPPSEETPQSVSKLRGGGWLLPVVGHVHHCHIFMIAWVVVLELDTLAPKIPTQVHPQSSQRRQNRRMPGHLSHRAQATTQQLMSAWCLLLLRKGR